jgi:phosphoribosylglycinamide formyltransferase-1
VDDGPVLGQSQVPVLPQDTPEALAARILEQEHQLYPQVIRSFIAQSFQTEWESPRHDNTLV